jgi:RNA polymerase sigma-70 factor (ECF subfamily)
MSTVAPPLPPASRAPALGPADQVRFAELLETHDRQMRVLALQLLGDTGKIDDAVQEAYLRALRALPRFRGDSSLGTWLHRIVHNVSLDEHRRSARYTEAPFDADLLDVAWSEGADAGVERADLAMGLARLPHGQRAAIVLVDGYGIDHAAAAELLGVRVGTVGSRVSRARAALRRVLDDQAGREARP